MRGSSAAKLSNSLESGYAETNARGYIVRSFACINNGQRLCKSCTRVLRRQWMYRKHGRQSMRLHGFDYARPGAYSITVCVEDRQCLFGRVDANHLQMNDQGRMIDAFWHRLSVRFAAVETDAFVVMPNHVHGIVHIGRGGHASPGPGGHAGLDSGGHAGLDSGGHMGLDSGGHMGPPLPVIMQWFKTLTTNAYIRGVRENAWPRFEGRLWQRGYYDHIVRGEDDLNRIRDYIARNPFNWCQDPLNL